MPHVNHGRLGREHGRANAPLLRNYFGRMRLSCDDPGKLNSFLIEASENKGNL